MAMAGTATAVGDKSKAAPESIKGQYVVQLVRPRSHYDTRALERKLDARIIDQIRPDLILIQRDSNETQAATLRFLNDNPAVEIAEPNWIYRIVKTPNDPEYGKLWGLNNAGGLDKSGTRGLKGVDIGAEKAWDITTGSRDVVVAVIDTGVDFKIPDLTANAWVNQAEANGQPGVDDDKNGYVDDIHGYNFVRDNGDSTDDNSHGSHCSGTIGGQGDDGRGIVGVNWNVSIMAVKFLDAAGSGTLANAVKAIDYARKMGAHILSNSWGGGGVSAILQKAIEDTRDAGQLFVAAAGNDGADNDKFPAYPASYPTENIISVAALDNRGQLADFSNFGINSVHVAAPGVNVLSTVPGGTAIYDGTSMATPHVAGVAALLLADKPGQGYVDLKKRILESARPLKTLKGRIQTGGLVDAYYALTGLHVPDDPNDPSLWKDMETHQEGTPHPYPANHAQTITIQRPGVSRIAIRFSKFETETGYDRVQFFNSKGESLGIMSGSRTGEYSPISDGDTIVLRFAADASVQGFGFDIDQVVYER